MSVKHTERKGFKAKLAGALANDRWGAFAVSLLCILLTMVVSGVILLALGKNPLTAFYAFLAGNGFAPRASYSAGSGMLSDMFQFLNVMAPMLLAALAFVFAYRCGLFNIGISGQMLLAGFIASVTVGYMKGMNGALAKVLILLIGACVGGLVGALIGFLKYRFNIQEVVSSIMFNYIISYVTGFLINAKYIDPISRASKVIASTSRLTYTKVLIGGFYCNVPLGILIAILTAIVVWWVFEKTVFGFELKAVGSNKKAARYAGINVGRNMIFAMMGSGILAGLAGVCYYCGYTNQIIPKSLPAMGFDSIATGLLGNAHPIGIIFSSILITIFQNGATNMSSMVGVAKEIASVIIGILLLFSACGGHFRKKAVAYLNALEDLKKKEEKEGGNA